MSTLEPIIAHNTDPRVYAAAAGLRPTAPYVVAPLIRFAPWWMTYKVDAGGAGTRVYFYGPGEHGHSVLVRAAGFYPYLYVELPRGVDARELVNEVNATVLHSLVCCDVKRRWAPERRAAAAGIVGVLRRRRGSTVHRAPRRESRFMPVVGYEIVHASIARGHGGDYGYRGIEPRTLLKIYFYSPAMLVRGRNLLLGKHAHLPPIDQAEALARAKFSPQDAAAVKEKASEWVSMRAFIKDVDTARNANAAAVANDVERGMPDNVDEIYHELDEATDAGDDDVVVVEAEEAQEAEVVGAAPFDDGGGGAEWRNDDTVDADERVAPHQSYEELEAKLETQFRATSLALLRIVRPSRAASILSRLTEAAPLKVCDADLDFTLRACTDIGIAPCAWVEVDTAALSLSPAMWRDERAGRVHSADGRHPGFPDATWMLDRTPPGVEPWEPRALRVLRNQESFCQLEVACDFHHIRPVADERMQLIVPEPITLSFDIETETGPNMAFSRPDAQRVFDIGCVIPYPAWTRSKKRWRYVVFALGAMTRTRAPDDADEHVLCFDDERQLQLAFYRFVALLRPDELVTFNGHDFDFRFLAGRAKTLGIEAEFAQCWGKCASRYGISIRPRHFESKAHGRHEMFEVVAEGVVSIDVYLMVIRNVGIKLKSYGLDSLSSTYLGDHKEKMSPADINPKQATADGRAELKTYVLKDAKLPLLLIQKQKWVLAFIEKSRLVGCTLNMQLERGMNIQGKALVYRWSRRGVRIPEAAAGIGIADAGQLRLVVNYTRTDYDRAHEHGRYEGAIVLDPGIGAYVMVVMTLDFNSLYPSIQISENMCVLVLIADDFDITRDPYLSYLVASGRFTWASVVRKLRTMVSTGSEDYRDAAIGGEDGAKPITFLTHGAMRGLLPDIQWFNLSQRRTVRNQMEADEESLKEIKDAVEAMTVKRRIEVLNERQLNLKLVANSMYGLGGSDKSFQYAPKIAAGVTLCGRGRIYYAKWIAENLLTLRADSPLVQRVRQFAGVKNLLLELPPGAVVAQRMLDECARVQALAAKRPLAMRQAAETSTAVTTATRAAPSLSKFFGAAVRSRSTSGLIKSEPLPPSEDSQSALEGLDNDVKLRTVYGDTDSIFVRFWYGLSRDEAATFCLAAADFISVCMHVAYGSDAVTDCVYRIEFEKLADAFLLLGKKKYAMLKYVLKKGKMVAKPAEGEPSLSGMEAGKRDTTPFVARGQQVAIRILLDRRHSVVQNMARARAYIWKELALPLRENRVDPYELVMTKQLRNLVAAYRAEGKAAPVHVQLAELRMQRAARGEDTAPRPGDRLPFIIRPGAEALSARGEDPVWALRHGVPPDATYYLETHVAPTLGRLFEPLLTAHRLDLKTDKERADVTHEFMFGSRTGYCAPPDADKYDFSEYADKSNFAPTIVRYTNRRRAELANNAFMRDLRPGADCVGCGRFLEERRRGAVCDECLHAAPALYMPMLIAQLEQLDMDERALKYERARIVQKCQSCVGCGERYAHITCTEWDCPVMWKRQANGQALVENAARALDVARSMNPNDW
jgi:DNA polymerase elongation subunit (family B)